MATKSDDQDSRYYGKVINELKLLIWNDKREINILLLGETGVGKSTFINSFANYLTHQTLADAQHKDPLALIPTSFTVSGEDFRQITVGIGSDTNEDHTPGQSATQQCKSFVFPFGERMVRLIDTPGIGDTRGVDQDDTNFEDILAYIGQFEEIDCICILLKPNNARITIMFEYCIKQLLSHLQKSASHNMVFVFTNTRSTFYRPGDTAPALREVLDRVKTTPPYVNIAFNQDNTFCLDNEAFRFLVALKNGIKFADSDFADFSKSWDFSANQCRRLVQYIIGVEGGRPGLTPHKVRDTQSVNEARRLITLLSQPLAEIAKNIDDNLLLMEVKKREIEQMDDNIESIEDRLYIPFFDLEIIQLKLPQTVCSAEKCRVTYNVHGSTKYDYKKCHAPCDIYGVQRDVLGDKRLKKCDIFTGWINKTCKNCGCSYKKHLHVYYETRVMEKYREDNKIKEMIEQQLETKVVAEMVVDNIGKFIKELKEEMQFIMQTTAKFAQFLKHNAIAPYNDTFKSYLDLLLENETSKKNCDPEYEIRIKNMLKTYEEAKELLSVAMTNNVVQSITVEQVFTLIDELYALKNYGNKIRQMRESQESARMSEMSMGEREVRFDPDKKIPSDLLKSISTKTDHVKTPSIVADEPRDETNVITREGGSDKNKSKRLTVKNLKQIFENN